MRDNWDRKMSLMTSPWNYSFPKILPHKHLTYRLTMQWICKKINLKQVTSAHIWSGNPKWKADLLSLCRNNRKCTTNINMWTLRVSAGNYFGVSKLKSLKQNEEIIWKWICGSHSQISWLRKSNKLFMLWYWSSAEDGWSHLSSRSGIQEFHCSDTDDTRYNLTNKSQRSQLFKGDYFSNHPVPFRLLRKTWRSKQGVAEELQQFRS